MKQYENMMQEFYETIHYLGLELNPVMMYQSFEHQFKQKYGSYRTKVLDEDYPELMQKRDDSIYCSINDVIESRLGYEKQNRKRYDEHIEFHKNLEHLEGLK